MNSFCPHFIDKETDLEHLMTCLKSQNEYVVK